MIQACRTDLSSMRFNSSYNCKPDKELIKCAEALALEAQKWMEEIIKWFDEKCNQLCIRQAVITVERS